MLHICAELCYPLHMVVGLSLGVADEWPPIKIGIFAARTTKAVVYWRCPVVCVILFLVVEVVSESTVY